MRTAVSTLLVLLFGASAMACEAPVAIEAALVAADLLRQDQDPLTARLHAEPKVSEHRIAAPDGEELPADLYQPAHTRGRLAVLVVYGLTQQGRQDPRLQRVGRVLGLAGMPTLIPDFPELKAMAPGGGTYGQVKAALRYFVGQLPAETQIAVLAFSFGVAPALQAIADPELAERIDLLIGFGGYGELRPCLRFALTGEADHNGARIAIEPPEFGRDAIARTLTALGAEDSPPVRGLLDGEGDFGARFEALPPELKARVEAMSPLASEQQPGARMIFLHSLNDPLIPYTESLKLAEHFEARGQLERLVLLEGFDHVNPLSALGDPAALEGIIGIYQTIRTLLELRE